MVGTYPSPPFAEGSRSQDDEHEWSCTPPPRLPPPVVRSTPPFRAPTLPSLQVIVWWCGVWSGVECGVVWCGVVWCGAVLTEVQWSGEERGACAALHRPGLAPAPQFVQDKRIPALGNALAKVHHTPLTTHPHHHDLMLRNPHHTRTSASLTTSELTL